MHRLSTAGILLLLLPSVTLAQEPLGPEFQVNTYTTGVQSRPAVAIDNIGEFVVTWSDEYQQNFSLGIFGQRFMAAPPVGIFADGFESGDTAAWSSTVP